jgi:hypothetical protein
LGGARGPPPTTPPSPMDVSISPGAAAADAAVSIPAMSPIKPNAAMREYDFTVAPNYCGTQAKTMVFASPSNSQPCVSIVFRVAVLVV